MLDTNVTVNGSAGSEVPIGAGDGGAGAWECTPAPPSSRLEALKSERSNLQRQFERLAEARAELEGPSLELQSVEAEAQTLELQTAEAVRDWAVVRGCQDRKPVANAAMAG
jgi:hypothetical protein